MNNFKENSYIAADIDHLGELYKMQEEIKKSEHLFRQNQVSQVKNYLLRNHKVSGRVKNTFTYKGVAFVPSIVLLQSMKTVINFHTAYLLGNPASLTGKPDAVKAFNKYYNRGTYSKTDWQILNELVTYGNAFEYVYYQEIEGKQGVIKSKVFRNEDSYPIYDENMNYVAFVEFWKNKSSGMEHYTIYYPDHVDTFIGSQFIKSSPNLTGLPIHYVAMDRAEYDQFGDSMLLDLIPIMDKVENLLSKIDDAVTILSLNPVGVAIGSKITETDMVNSNIAGAVLNMEEGSSFEYANAVLDYNSIKFELDQLYQQFNMIAAIPSSIIGQSNIANVSENTTSIIYQLTENRGKQNMQALIDGFKARWDKMRLLMELDGVELADDDFDSLNVTFNVTKPIDTKNNMENMQMQYEMGAISKQTIIEQSPYTSDAAQEIERLQTQQNGSSDSDFEPKETENA